MQRHRLKEFFKECEWRTFEQFVAEFWSRGGWMVTLTDAQGDGGIDVYLEHPAAEYTIGVEVMRHKRGSLSGSDVKDAFWRAKPNNFGDVFCLLSTTQFSPSAKQAARNVGCDLIGLDAFCQAVDEADDMILCQQYKMGNGWVEDEEDLLTRLGSVNVSISQGARGHVLESRFTNAILYRLETMDDPPPVVTEPQVEDIEADIADTAPTREYPVRGGYAPAWQGGPHPAADVGGDNDDEATSDPTDSADNTE